MFVLWPPSLCVACDFLMCGLVLREKISAGEENEALVEREKCLTVLILKDLRMNSHRKGVPRFHLKKN